MRNRLYVGAIVCALIALVAATSAFATSGGAANNVSLGAAQSNPVVSGDNPTGSATFVVNNVSKSVVYDLSVYISSGGFGCSYPYGGEYPPPGNYQGPPPLTLAGKPAHMNPNVQSFTGNPYGARWHIVKLAPKQSLSLKLVFNIPQVVVQVPPPYDPNAPASDPSTWPTTSVPQLCVTASLNGDSDNSFGPTTSVSWSGEGPYGGK